MCEKKRKKRAASTSGDEGTKMRKVNERKEPLRGWGERGEAENTRENGGDKARGRKPKKK